MTSDLREVSSNSDLPLRYDTAAACVSYLCGTETLWLFLVYSYSVCSPSLTLSPSCHCLSTSLFFITAICPKIRPRLGQFPAVIHIITPQGAIGHLVCAYWVLWKYHNSATRFDLEDKTWTDKVSKDNARRYIIKGHCTPVLSGSWFYCGPSKFPLSDLKEHSPGTHPYLNIPHCIINNRPSAQRDAALQHFIFYRNSFNNIILESPQGFQCHHLNAKMSP